MMRCEQRFFDQYPALKSIFYQGFKVIKMPRSLARYYNVVKGFFI